MTPSELKRHVEARGSKFFTRENMRFGGDTMRNYGVRAITIDGEEHLELYRRRPVKLGLKKSAYFRADDFSQRYRG